jgi:hypothetical protein
MGSREATPSSTMRCPEHALLIVEERLREQQAEGIRVPEGAHDLARILTGHRAILSLFPREHALLLARLGAKGIASGLLREGLGDIREAIRASDIATRLRIATDYGPFVARALARAAIRHPKPESSAR